ncbi:MFS transporter [Cohnella suwonensis]|uniref:MFS transporter n=1 Tax=Cohnella suwonensis TaxID=696072 RepID=A0ABW0LYL5_9BACL
MARLIFLGCVAYLAIGLGHLVLGTIMEPMVDAYGIKYGDGGQLVMNQFLGGMFGMLMTPWLIGRLGKKTLLLGAFTITVIAEAVYALQPAWGVMLASAPFAGLGLGLTEAIVGSIIIGSAARDRANVAMSRVEVFFGVGALIMPFVGAWLIANGHWIAAFIVVGALMAATLALWIAFWPTIVDEGGAGAGVGADEVAASAENGGASASSRGRATLVLAIGALFFLVYVGSEMSFVHYLPSLLVNDNGLSDSTASLSLSVYWGAMVVGRIVSGYAADRWGGGIYMLVTCVSGAIIFVALGGLHTTEATFVLTLLAGLAMSGMFSVALVYTNHVVPGVTERTTSLLMASGGIGGALLPKLTGWFLDECGTDATRWLFAGMAIVMLAVIVAQLVAARGLRGIKGVEVSR